MRSRAALGGIFASVGILIVGWQIGAATATPTVTASTSTGDTGTDTTNDPTPTPTPTRTPSTSTTGTAASATDGTYTGSVVDTRFGTVEVQLTISGGTITDVTALKLTDKESRSVQISNRAAPILASEVLASQSANVQNVSGATYTTQAYLQSLQSALDEAGF